MSPSADVLPPQEAPIPTNVPDNDDALSVSSSSSSGGEESWQDLSPETDEPLTVLSLIDDAIFPSIEAMLAHCATHGFDLLAERKRLRLDFLGTVKLVNFLRANKGEIPGRIEREELDLEGEGWLRPVLEDDALLMGLGDLLGDDDGDGGEEGEDQVVDDGQTTTETVENLRAKNKALLAEMKLLRRQFDDYRLAVAETLDTRWESADNHPSSSSSPPPKDESAYYWTSYAGTEIHETMLKDTVRTDAYRDFIYRHKAVFAGKTVLDVGCGTGILSMFAARAGAARVIAVDKSDIIHKARANIYANGLDGVITTLHGAVEELVLPVESVDVIVSEWMGYALLYEAMLPSVLYARDRWLAPGGLMVPSLATLWIAPLADEEYVMDNVAFWRDVYGFDMRPMQMGIHAESRVAVVPESSACAPAAQFLRLDLQTVTAADLSFTAPWAARLSRRVDALDGFLVWFDIFFTPGPDSSGVVDGTTAAEWSAKDPTGGNVAFTTGPAGKPTHWMQTVLLAKPEEGKEEKEKEEEEEKLKEGTEVRGEITYAVLKGDKSARALSVDVAWGVGGGEGRTQRWTVQ